jgi:hypothetical protein
MAVATVLVLASVGLAQEVTTVSTDRSVGVQGVIPVHPDGEPVRFLVPLGDGVKIEPILSTGDVVAGPKDVRKKYQMTGIPDGLGAFRDGGMLNVLMNHELEAEAPPDVGARVSWLAIDPETLDVKSASYPITGREGFLRFCSSTFRYIDGKPLYFTGEESTDDGSLTKDTTDGMGRGGSSIVLNANTGEHRQTRHFGLLPHENIVPVKGLERADLLTTEDGDAQVATKDADPAVNEAQLYSYIAPTFGGAISGDHGSLYAWKANPGQGQDDDPSTDDIAQGETLEGHFVRISKKDNTDADALEAAVQAKDAFDFVRLEDAAVSKAKPNVVYINDTGSLGSESGHGRLYKLKIDEDDPRDASLILLIDGDTSKDPVQMTNPDNLDTSKSSIVIQEDRNDEYRQSDDPGGGYGRVLVYDLETEKLRAVARVNTPSNAEPGEWESSGVINASKLLGEDQWLLDVQAHSIVDEEQPGRKLVPDSSVGEDGQLLRIKIPNS